MKIQYIIIILIIVFGISFYAGTLVSLSGVAQESSTVRVHYSLVVDGELIDASGETPLQFRIGSGMLIPGFEQAVIGMAPGQQKTVSIPPSEAYGEFNPGLLQVAAKSDYPNVTVGDTIIVTSLDGTQTPVKIAKIDDTVVTLDYNHPLAGKTLEFTIGLVEII